MRSRSALRRARASLWRVPRPRIARRAGRPPPSPPWHTLANSYGGSRPPARSGTARAAPCTPFRGRRTICATRPGRGPRRRQSQALRKRHLMVLGMPAHSMDCSGSGGTAMAHSDGCRAGRRYHLAGRGRCLGRPILDAAILPGLPRRAAGMPRQAGAASGEALFRSPAGGAARAGRDGASMAGDWLPAERGASGACHAYMKNAAQPGCPGRMPDAAWPGNGSLAGRADALDGRAP